MGPAPGLELSIGAISTLQKTLHSYSAAHIYTSFLESTMQHRSYGPIHTCMA